jgi:DNA-binding response OmpR family regulator
MPVVLILEDDPLIALDMAMIVEANMAAEVVVTGTLAAARNVNPGDVDVAILDVNIGSATSFDFAREMLKAGVPVAFASGSRQASLPEDLAGVAFFSKPCSRLAVVNFVRAALTVRRASS